MRLTLALAAATLVFGAIGTWKYEHRLHSTAPIDDRTEPVNHPTDPVDLPTEPVDYPTEPVDLVSVAYHSLQLLALHAPHLEHRIPWELHVGRLLGAAFDFVAALTAAFRIFPDMWKLIVLRLSGTPDHVVICGLGEAGARIALEARRRRLPVVAIEHACPPDVRQLMRTNGVLVLDGDATDGAQLRAARVDRASIVVTACPTDEINVSITSTIVAMVSETPWYGEPLFCRLLSRDSQTRQLLALGRVFNRNSRRYHVDFNELDRDAITTRQALDRHFLDFEPIREHDDVLVHLVVIGCGAAGRALALRAVRIGHFANQVGPLKRRLRVTLVDETADDALAQLTIRYPNLPHVCDITREQLNKADLDRLSQVAGAARTLTTYAFCNDDEDGDRINFERALLRARRLHEQSAHIQQSAQILVRQRSHGSLVIQLESDLQEQHFDRLYAFGMFEDVFGWDVVMHKDQDRLASALHDDYLDHHAKDRKPGRDYRAWEALDDETRDSNRHAADHIPVKLRALGYHMAHIKDHPDPPLSRFEETEIDLLARMEHARWCVERWLAGWTYGPVFDRERKINPNLVDWDQLPPAKQQKDPEQVNAIPRALKKIGLGIYPGR